MELSITEMKLLPAKYDSRRNAPKPRIHIFPEGETLLNNLINRRNRPIKLYRKAMEKALDSLEVNRSLLDIKWSQKAGCACGCSPGFIVNGWSLKLHRKNLYVTVTSK